MNRLYKIFSKIFLKLNTKPKSEIAILNRDCNEVFENIYAHCRIDFGRELVELMGIKRRVWEKCEIKGNCTPVQEMLIKKMLELICLYFKLADSIVSIKTVGNAEKTVNDYVDITKEKMISIHNLVNSLNNQFYMKSDYSSSEPLCDDLINEAEALRNVIDESITKDYREKYYE